MVDVDRRQLLRGAAAIAATSPLQSAAAASAAVSTNMAAITAAGFSFEELLGALTQYDSVQRNLKDFEDLARAHSLLEMDAPITEIMHALGTAQNMRGFCGFQLSDLYSPTMRLALYAHACGYFDKDVIKEWKEHPDSDAYQEFEPLEEIIEYLGIDRNSNIRGADIYKIAHQRLSDSVRQKLATIIQSPELLRKNFPYGSHSNYEYLKLDENDARKLNDYFQRRFSVAALESHNDAPTRRFVFEGEIYWKEREELCSAANLQLLPHEITWRNNVVTVPHPSYASELLKDLTTRGDMLVNDYPSLHPVEPSTPARVVTQSEASGKIIGYASDELINHSTRFDPA
jgi:hypothetical protein